MPQRWLSTEAQLLEQIAEERNNSILYIALSSGFPLISGRMVGGAWGGANNAGRREKRLKFTYTYARVRSAVKVNIATIQYKVSCLQYLKGQGTKFKVQRLKSMWVYMLELQFGFAYLGSLTRPAFYQLQL